MKKKPASKSAFFNPRVLTSFAFCLIGSLLALADHGCRTVSLTVTTSNASAIQLYERMGFVNRRDFAAYVWEMK